MTEQLLWFQYSCLENPMDRRNCPGALPCGAEFIHFLPVVGWSSLRCYGHQLEVTQCPGLPSVPTTWPPPQAVRNLESFFPKAQPAKVDFFMMSCGQWGASQPCALIFHWSESSYRPRPQWRGGAAPGEGAGASGMCLP